MYPPIESRTLFHVVGVSEQSADYSINSIHFSSAVIKYFSAMRVTLCILVLLALIALVKTHAANSGYGASTIAPKGKEQKKKKEKMDRLNNRKKNSKNKTNSNGGSQDKVKEDTSKDNNKLKMLKAKDAPLPKQYTIASVLG